MEPPEAVAKKEELTHQFSVLTENMKLIQKEKPRVWLEMRKQTKTAKEADMYWAASDMGIEEVQIKLTMVALSKEISSLNSIIRNGENEARNLY